MSRNRIFVFLIGILLLSNLALVGFFILNKPQNKESHPSRERPSSYMKEALKKDVGFSDDQLAKYDKMVDAHRQQMHPLFEDITKTKENFYKLLMQPGTPDSTLNKAADEIGEKQKNIDLKMFTHFQNLRQLCTPAQQPMFDSVVQRVVHRMIFPMRRPDNKQDIAAQKKNN